MHWRVIALCGWMLATGSIAAGQATRETGASTKPAAGFLEAKTCFQTNVAYDPRVAIAVDAVIVHQHGAPLDRLKSMIGSWKAKGFPVGRMFFADSDATNAYWKGKWDGEPHPQEVERNAKGEVVMCAGVRPYMLPTEGWTRHLEEMVRMSVEAGADAILPEEPLAHVFSGHEEAFKALWEKRYGRDWEPENRSPEARYLTAQLKGELYAELERRLAAETRRQAERTGREIPFVVPIHSMYSNVASQLVAPLGTSLKVEGVDGYIGQVWTGPVNWALANYGGEDKSFFSSAYCLYDYFVALASGTGRKLWLLSDPVEDDPNHTWDEFEQWYRHCVAAKLMFAEADAFEVMPWPDRIFLPGHSTGGGTPAPARYRTMLLSVIQALQELPAEGVWCDREGKADASAMTTGVGVAVSDGMMGEGEAFPMLQHGYGLLMPLVEAGVPATACVMERATEPRYLDRFRVIVTGYEASKPPAAETNAALAAWVRTGGALVVLGEGAELGEGSFWWKEAGYASPTGHLMHELGLAPDAKGDFVVGKGAVLRRPLVPGELVSRATCWKKYFPLIQTALARHSAGEILKTPGAMVMRRGDFIAACATREPVSIQGPVVDLFDPDLPVLEQVTLARGESGLYREAADRMMPAAHAEKGRPDRIACVLHATHRLMAVTPNRDGLTCVVRGPLETPGAVRVFTAGRATGSVAARTADGADLKVETVASGETMLIRFPNQPEGAEIRIDWR